MSKGLWHQGLARAVRKKNGQEYQGQCARPTTLWMATLVAMALAMVMMVVTRVKMVMMMTMHVHLTPARMPRSMQATQGPAWMSHGLPGTLYKACPRAPRPQSLEDEALLSLDPSTPGALVMIVVLVVTIVTISPSARNSFVVVVVVWLDPPGAAGVGGVGAGV